MEGIKKTLARWITVCLLSQVAAWGTIDLSAAPAHATRPCIEDSVVKILTVYNEPDYDQPWQMRGQDMSCGSGCVLRGHRILTAAHVVSDQTFVQVQRVGDPLKYAAEVAAVGHDCDLALLRVEDPAFFDGLPPLKIGELPQPRDPVTVYGFPVGGNKLSVTEGVVSRIEVTEYVHSKRSLLDVQVDAAINPGNSGGPAVKDGALVGIAHQGLPGADNVGYIVPAPIVTHFLEDLKDGRYDGFPYDDLHVQKLENPSHRAYLGMNNGQTGILVTRVAYGSSSWGIIKEGDVILEIEGMPVANDGTVPFEGNDRIDATYLLIRKQVGERLRIKVLRHGQIKETVVTLRGGTDIVPKPEYDVRPRYYIFGGLVFMPLTFNYLNTWKNPQDAPPHLLDHYFSDIRTPDREEIVIMKCVLADTVNIGYHDYADEVVTEIDKNPVSGMQDLVNKIENARGPYLEIGLESDLKIVLEVRQARQANARILRRYGIPSDRSDDLRAKGPTQQKGQRIG